MSIKIALADDSDVMRSAIKTLLAQESSIELIGEAATFGAAMQIVSDFKPEVLLLDLHLPEKRDFPPALVKAQLATIPHTLAVSFSNDEEARALAASYGAEALLDKMNLHGTLIPAIVHCCRDKAMPKAAIPPRRPSGIGSRKSVA